MLVTRSLVVETNDATQPPHFRPHLLRIEITDVGELVPLRDLTGSRVFDSGVLTLSHFSWSVPTGPSARAEGLNQICPGGSGSYAARYEKPSWPRLVGGAWLATTCRADQPSALPANTSGLLARSLPRQR